MPLSSMTGFAAMRGQAGGLDWTLEVRSVNARGLDIRMRLPEGLEALEPVIRGKLQGALSRGSVQVALRVGSGEAGGEVAVNEAAVEGLLEAAGRIAAMAEARGISFRPVSVGEILSHRAATENGRGPERMKAVADAVKAALPDLAGQLIASRQGEGAALQAVLQGQVARVAELTADAERALGDRKAAQQKVLHDRVEAILGTLDRVEEDRLAQELAMIAVKSDISEEIDRLKAHVDTASSLLTSDGAVGRKLDFLMQEFNREANTLCSKSQDAALTDVGLEMNAVIDQMREQAANIE